MSPTTRFLSDPRQNRLFAALADVDLERLRPALEPVHLRIGQVLCESGVPMTHVYFPTTAIVSLLYVTRDGGSAEVAVVGNDGVVGVSLFMGGNATPSQAVVQSGGCAFRMRAEAVQEEIERAGPTLQVMLRYAQAMIAQVAQTAMCNRYHSIGQQLARRLLLALDRSPSDGVAMTQEALAHLLGVRREGVTAAALKLQMAGVIRYSRGHIAVLNRASLEHHTCECYASVRKEYDRLLPPLPVQTTATPQPASASHEPPFEAPRVSRLPTAANRRAKGIVPVFDGLTILSGLGRHCGIDPLAVA
jgi:CRP-like cAMP-binding protein